MQQRQIVCSRIQGLVPYARGLAAQNALMEYKVNNRHENPADVFLFLEHFPVYTAGRRAKQEQLDAESKVAQMSGADYVKTLRGGQTTYHGPGQLIGYGIMDLKAMNMTARCYMTKLEEAVRNVVRSYDVPVMSHSESEDIGLGVFVSEHKKIASLGVHVSRYVTQHGFGLNVERQAEPWFLSITPCGLQNMRLVSLESEMGSRKCQDAVGAIEQDTVCTIESSITRSIHAIGSEFGRDMTWLGQEKENAWIREILEKYDIPIKE